MTEPIVVKNKGLSNGKYINIYVNKGSYTELHITNTKDKDTVLLIDNDDVHRCKDFFWCITMAGREGYRKEQVYANIKKGTKLYLNHLIINAQDGERVSFLNRDCLDFRKDNLAICGLTLIKSAPRRNKKSGLPSGITERKYDNGNIIGYYVDARNNYAKYFGIKKYGTIESAKENAILYKQYLDQLKIS